MTVIDVGDAKRVCVFKRVWVGDRVQNASLVEVEVVVCGSA